MGIYRQLIKHVAALFEHIVVGIVLVNQRNGLGIAGLCLVILAQVEVEAAQRQLADGLVHTVACALLGGELVILDGVGRVAVSEVQVADGIVNLVQIILVAVITGHAFQCLDLAGDIGALIHGALLDARVELGSVRGAVAAASLFECQVGVMLISDFLIELSQQETHAHLLVTLEALHGSGQVGDGFLGLLRNDIVVGKGRIGQCSYFFVGDLVKVDMREHIICLGGPTQRAIAQGLAHLTFLHQVFFPSEVTGDVAEGRGGIQEIALHVLCLGQHVPGVVKIGIVLVAGEPFLILGVAVLAALALGLLLDGVQGDGLFHLLDGAVKTAGGLGCLGIGTGLGGMHVQVL